MSNSAFIEALNGDDYRAIGRVIVTFAHLEHALLQAAMALSGTFSEENTAQQSTAMEDGALQTFGPRVDFFIKSYRAEFGDDEWITSQKEQLEYAAQLRNQFAHGSWDKLANGRLTVRFFSRKAIKAGQPGYDMEMTEQDLDYLSESNKALVKILHDRFFGQHLDPKPPS